MKLKKYFDKIYCINLDHRKDRWEESVNEFKKWGVYEEITRFSAINGNNLNCSSYPINCGELGLIETHIKIIEDAIKNNYEKILLVEDDIEFTDKITNLDFYFDQLPKKWDMVWFGGNHNKHMGVEPEYFNDHIIKCRKTYSTHCFGIDKNVYDLVLNIISKKQKPVDVYYTDIQKIYNCYSFNPSIALQRPSYSDIQNIQQDNRWLF